MNNEQMQKQIEEMVKEKAARREKEKQQALKRFLKKMEEEERNKQKGETGELDKKKEKLSKRRRFLENLRKLIFLHREFDEAAKYIDDKSAYGLLKSYLKQENNKDKKIYFNDIFNKADVEVLFAIASAYPGLGNIVTAEWIIKKSKLKRSTVFASLKKLKKLGVVKSFKINLHETDDLDVYNFLVKGKNKYRSFTYISYPHLFYYSKIGYLIKTLKDARSKSRDTKSTQNKALVFIRLIDRTLNFSSIYRTSFDKDTMKEQIQDMFIRLDEITLHICKKSKSKSKTISIIRSNDILVLKEKLELLKHLYGFMRKFIQNYNEKHKDCINFLVENPNMVRYSAILNEFGHLVKTVESSVSKFTLKEKMEIYMENWSRIKISKRYFLMRRRPSDGLKIIEIKKQLENLKKQ